MKKLLNIDRRNKRARTLFNAYAIVPPKILNLLKDRLCQTLHFSLKRSDCIRLHSQRVDLDVQNR